MSLIQINYISDALSRNVTVNAVLPYPVKHFPGTPQPEPKPFKSLYLLHGILGNYTDWVSGTRIQELAEENNIAVFMPSGENSFYTDDKIRGNNFGEFVGEELVEVTRNMFRLSEKREDTCIAGLSMGGYGAIRNGLKYHKTFGKIAALSSALVIYDAEKSTDDAPFAFGKRSYYEAVFGPIADIKTSDTYPEYLVKQIKAAGDELPEMYMACGTEDSLIELNRRFSAFLKEENAVLKYEEGPGAHSWDFWDEYIKKVVDWFK